jgi:antitoxin HigA-1
MAKPKKLTPIHPGEILRQDFIVPMNLSMNKLALHLRVPVTRIAEIVHERRSISADTAMRLAVYFGTTPQFWLNLQQAYDLAIVQDKLADEIRKEVRPLKARHALL